MKDLMKQHRFNKLKVKIKKLSKEMVKVNFKF